MIFGSVEGVVVVHGIIIVVTATILLVLFALSFRFLELEGSHGFVQGMLVHKLSQLGTQRVSWNDTRHVVDKDNVTKGAGQEIPDGMVVVVVHIFPIDAHRRQGNGVPKLHELAHGDRITEEEEIALLLRQFFVLLKVFAIFKGPQVFGFPVLSSEEARREEAECEIQKVDFKQQESSVASRMQERT